MSLPFSTLSLVTEEDTGERLVLQPLSLRLPGLYKHTLDASFFPRLRYVSKIALDKCLFATITKRFVKGTFCADLLGVRYADV